MPVPLAAPLITAGAGILGAGMGFIGGERTNEANARQAALNRDFQERMRATQYQTAVEDMRKAGLNPILAYKQGGAGSASGADYTPGNVGAAAVSGASTATSSALAARAQDMQLENIAADTRLKESQDKTQAALQVQAMAQANQANSQSALNEAVKTRTNVDTLISTENLQSAKAAAERAKADEAFYATPEGQALRTLDQVRKSIIGH